LLPDVANENSKNVLALALLSLQYERSPGSHYDGAPFTQRAAKPQGEWLRSIFGGDTICQQDWLVQVPGEALHIRTDDFQRAAQASSVLRNLVGPRRLGARRDRGLRRWAR
jgi:hypothetical protein